MLHQQQRNIFQLSLNCKRDNEKKMICHQVTAKNDYI